MLLYSVFGKVYIGALQYERQYSVEKVHHNPRQHSQTQPCSTKLSHNKDVVIPDRQF